ncbi:hypothetical protein [Streptomyces sp. NPDC005890]|uniref:hypothetical protein n=1 Tax=Streptomyces sp. NPDC005890 TaxID=3154568 RepID=UPI0033CB78D6
MTAKDPAVRNDLFTGDVDERPVQFVHPADTDRPTSPLILVPALREELEVQAAEPIRAGALLDDRRQRR